MIHFQRSMKIEASSKVHVSKISLNSSKSNYSAVQKQLELLKIEISTQEQK